MCHRIRKKTHNRWHPLTLSTSCWHLPICTCVYFSVDVLFHLHHLNENTLRHTWRQADYWRLASSTCRGSRAAAQGRKWGLLILFHFFFPVAFFSLLWLTVDLQVSFESGSSSGILGFAFISSRVLQLNVGDFQHRLGLAQPRLFGDVAIYLPPCDCRHWTVTREEAGGLAAKRAKVRVREHIQSNISSWLHLLVFASFLSEWL